MDMQVTYSHLRENLSSIMDKIEDNSLVCAVTRKGHKPIILMTLDDYESMDETAYLTSSPENKKRLMKSIKQIEQGKTIKVDLKDLDQYLDDNF